MSVLFVTVYQLVVLAVAVATHFLVRPLAHRSLLAERGAYLALCYICTAQLPDHVKDLTGVASASSPLAHFLADCCAVLVFWRFMELVFGTAPSHARDGTLFFFVAFVAMPAVEIRFTPSGKPEVPRQVRERTPGLSCPQTPAEGLSL